MFCKNCGVLNEENAKKCIMCGQSLSEKKAPNTKQFNYIEKESKDTVFYSQPAKDYMLPAVLTACLCNIIAGIIAIY